jgi:hypothetical protein
MEATSVGGRFQANGAGSLPLQLGNLDFHLRYCVVQHLSRDFDDLWHLSWPAVGTVQQLTGSCQSGRNVLDHLNVCSRPVPDHDAARRFQGIEQRVKHTVHIGLYTLAEHVDGTRASRTTGPPLNAPKPRLTPCYLIAVRQAAVTARQRRSPARLPLKSLALTGAHTAIHERRMPQVTAVRESLAPCAILPRSAHAFRSTRRTVTGGSGAHAATCMSARERAAVCLADAALGVPPATPGGAGSPEAELGRLDGRPAV